MNARGYGIYEFGPFRLDQAERMLSGAGQVVALSPKALDLLIALVTKAGRVVDKEELMREVWPDTFVEENNLTVNISALRRAPGSASSDQDYIQTVPRRGYRFVASVRQAAESALLAPGGTAKPTNGYAFFGLTRR
jgi:DNA-binding winged helix-turn-helix (wHTH) protein